MANLFLAFEPQIGWRAVQVSRQHFLTVNTRLDCEPPSESHSDNRSGYYVKLTGLKR